MTYTDSEKKLYIRLHELGVRPEIQIGDWVIHLLPLNGKMMLCQDGGDKNFFNDKRERDKIALLLDWSRAREWLRERGWILCDHVDDYPVGILIEFRHKDDHEKIRSSWGQTDLEAILAVMVQVAEEGK